MKVKVINEKGTRCLRIFNWYLICSDCLISYTLYAHVIVLFESYYDIWDSTLSFWFLF